jgi:pyruvate formate-lyase/glycerol dehydratase family glycyl radical enzyme
MSQGEKGVMGGLMKQNSARAQRIWNSLRDKRDAGMLSLARARLLTASYRETEGLPMPIRRAKAFAKILAEIPIYIEEHQLLVGDFAAKPMWAEWYPEFAVSWVEQEIDTGDEFFRAQSSEVDEQKAICEYWKGRSVEGAYLSSLSEEERKRFVENGEDGAWVYGVSAQLDRPGGYHVVAYDRLIREGCVGIRRKAEEELRATPVKDIESFQKANFLKAIDIVYRALGQYSQRYAVMARELAKTTKKDRRKELERIAEICEWVPEHPARSFYEAVQTLWFVHVFLYLELRPAGVSPGRADQYLYPYYMRDIKEGKLTREEAVEILECLRVKMCTLRHFNRKSFREGTSAEAQFHNITLGGQTPDGGDATNELSYLFVEAALRTRTIHNTLSVRWHDRIPQDFVLKGIELVSTGLGFPAFFNDDGNISFSMSMGATLEEARDYAIGGCVVPIIAGQAGPYPPFVLSMGKCMELALNNGFDPNTRKQLGPETGRFEEFQTFNEFVDAFKEQVRHFSYQGAALFNLQRYFRATKVPSIFSSALTDDCITRGKSAIEGGARFNYPYYNAEGMIDAADSLAAIKNCVFEEGSVSKADLMGALTANFEGKEEIHRSLSSAPKYGNDNDYVDSIAHDLYDWWRRMVAEMDASFGQKYLPCAYSVSLHHAYGARVGALPSGRLAWKSLADGSISAAQGCDTHGPTALINSAGKIDQYPILATLLNMKFQPAILKTEEDMKKMIALIKTYFDYGGRHIQFNVVEKETLMDAQVHPELHRDLIVRVAGYSAYFNELDRGVQDEIIQRTEHAL